MTCDCAARSSADQVFTCPVCSWKTYRALVLMDALQMDLFEDRESVSVSALIGLKCDEEHRAKFVARLSDGLPF